MSNEPPPISSSSPPKNRKAGYRHYKNDEIIEALKATGGMVYMAARKLGCDPSAISKRARVSPEIREAIENARGDLLDMAETALKMAVKDREAWAVCFTLKTIGKHRGYVERVEQTGINGGAIEVKATDYRVAAKSITSE